MFQRRLSFLLWGLLVALLVSESELVRELWWLGSAWVPRWSEALVCVWWETMLEHVWLGLEWAML